MPASARHGVAIFFVNRQGQVLLRLRSNDPGIAFPNQWDTIGGAVEPGEDHATAAARETVEEIGIELSGQAYWRDYQSVVLLHIYAAPLDLLANQIDLTEGQRVEWFDLDSARNEPLHAWVAAMLPEFVTSELHRQMRTEAARISNQPKGNP